MSEPISIRGLHHISLRTTRLEASRAFYRDLLGFREIPRVRFDFDGAWLLNYGIQIHLIVDPAYRQPDGPIQTRHEHIAFEIHDPEPVERALRAAGVELKVNVQASSGVRQLFCRDPDGHYLEFGAYGPTKTTGSW
ncbi:MAG TPA: VOC family protein [Pirellulales bacterium]|jgi:catechol 2,3-dioxygenase-like lactoylglutathione lyase family enzyme|nr:VOC family protein [Pirellulales bacterium]